jgi:hypothetical protein
MQNAECRNRAGGPSELRMSRPPLWPDIPMSGACHPPGAWPQSHFCILHSAFCILHSAFCILHSAFCIRSPSPAENPLPRHSCIIFRSHSPPPHQQSFSTLPSPTKTGGRPAEKLSNSPLPPLRRKGTKCRGKQPGTAVERLLESCGNHRLLLRKTCGEGAEKKRITCGNPVEAKLLNKVYLHYGLWLDASSTTRCCVVT